MLLRISLKQIHGKSNANEQGERGIGGGQRVARTLTCSSGLTLKAASSTEAAFKVDSGSKDS